MNTIEFTVAELAVILDDVKDGQKRVNDMIAQYETVEDSFDLDQVDFLYRFKDLEEGLIKKLELFLEDKVFKI